MMKVNGFEKMNKKELIGELKKRGLGSFVFDYHCITKKEIIEMIMEPINEAKEASREELGRDFNRAVSFYKQLKNIDFLEAEDYDSMTNSWNIMSSILDITEDGSLEVTADEDMLIQIANEMRDLFAPGTDISKYSHEELSSFVESCIEQFSLAVFTERLVKDSTNIVKMSMDNIDSSPNGAFFDSSRAMVLTGQKVDYEKRDSIMRIVDSSEDGISRMLEEKGLSSMTVFMGQVDNNEEKQKELDDKKRTIFRYGITDVASGKHYMWAFQSPSSTRKANYTFVEAQNWNDVLELWYEMTGTKNWEGFKKVFLDKENKAVFAKMKARISTRGSNSFSVSKISPKWADKIAQARIDYTKDIECEILRPFMRRNEETGMLEYIDNEKRILIGGDGQMIGSFEFHATKAVALRIISETEYWDFMRLWEAIGKDVTKVKPGSYLHKLILKIPNVFQIRHESKKGISVRFNLEAIEATKDIDLIVPESARKFIAGEWDEFPLEICNFLKKKKPWVSLNPQFISALQHESPLELIPIADYWLNYAKESVTDMVKAQQFHGIAKSSDDEEKNTVGSNLVAALRTNADLINESQVCNWRKDQYRKFLDDMRIGRIMVPGTYTYMVCDPAYLIEKTYGVEVPHLQAGEYYYQGKTCQAGLFRSPLIHPSEAQKVQLVNNKYYWYMKDVIVFNCYDGTWDRMGGADFDGDTCAVVPDDTEFGDIIVRGIVDYGYDIVIPSDTAKKEVFDKDNLDNFIEHLVQTARRDNTGKLTNEANYALDISNHLRSLVWYAKNRYDNIESISFIHPQAFGEDLGHKFQIQSGVKSQSGKNTLVVRGFVEAKVDFAGNLTWKAPKILGEKTLEEVMTYSRYYLKLAGFGKINVGKEIDKAKTGKELTKKEYTEEMQIKMQPHHQKIRKTLQGRPISPNNLINEFRSFSAMGRLCDYIGGFEEKGSKAYEINELLSNGSDKMFMLHSLLTREESQALKIVWNMDDGTQQTVIDMMKARKKDYNLDIRTLITNLSDDEERTLAIANRKEREVKEILELAQKINATVEVMAVAAYIAAYDKDTKQNESLTYGWLLFDALLSVFSRGNKKFELFKLPAKLDTDADIRIENSYMFINDRKYMPVSAYDTDKVALQVINGNNYAFVRKVVSNVQEQTFEDVLYNNTVYTIGAVGFKYHIAGDNPKETWKQIVASNNYIVDIVMDATNRAVISVNGCSISALMRNTNFELMNKKIKFVNSHATKKETAATITGLQCVIIGEADK